MPQWLNTALTVFYVVWLFTVLYVLWQVWKRQVARLQTLEMALMRDAKISAESAAKAAEAACMLAAKVTITTIESNKP